MVESIISLMFSLVNFSFKLKEIFKTYFYESSL